MDQTFTFSTIILTISLSMLSAIVGGIITGIFNLSSKNKEYRNEYYKMIVQKRIKAYEDLEKLNIKFKWVNKDNKYYICFSSKEKAFDALKACQQVVHNELWFTKEIFIEIANFYSLLNEIVYCKNEIELIPLAIEKHSLIRRNLDNIIKISNKDMLELYDIEKFLKPKKNEESIKDKIFKKKPKWLNFTKKHP